MGACARGQRVQHSLAARALTISFPSSPAVAPATLPESSAAAHMLARHAQRAARASALAAARAPGPSVPSYARRAPRAAAAATGARAFSASSARRDETPRSPFQTFVDVLRDELRKNRALQDNVKQLQGDVDKLQDSEAMKRARDAYERARVRWLVSVMGMAS
jgi:hypothetical protein